MSEVPENLTLIHLRRLDERMDRMALDVQELKTRMTSVKQQVANLAATQASHTDILSARLDCVETHLDRIGRRLDLLEPVR